MTVVATVPVQASVISPAPLSGKIWQIASALFLCAALTFGVLFFFQKKDNGPDLSGEVKSLTLEKEDLQKQVDGLQGREKTLTQTNSSLRKQVDDLKGQVSSQNSRISTLQNENAKLTRQVNEYKPKAERWDRSMNSK